MNCNTNNNMWNLHIDKTKFNMTTIYQCLIRVEPCVPLCRNNTNDLIVFHGFAISRVILHDEILFKDDYYVRIAARWV